MSVACLLAFAMAAVATCPGAGEISIQSDVAIVGGGYAGMSAAYLVAGKYELSVSVLEASNTTGGRTKNWDTRGSRPDVSSDDVIELGGQWLANSSVQPHSWELVVEDLQFKVFDAGYTPDDGNGVIYTSEGRHNFTTLLNGFHKLPKKVQRELKRAGDALETLQKGVSLESPWDHPRAREWDGMTFETWINATVKLDESRTILNVLCTTMIAQSASVVSFLHILFYIRAAGSLSNLVVAEQEYRVRGGTQGPVLAMAEIVNKTEGSSVHLSTPVRKIHQDAHGVHVYGENAEGCPVVVHAAYAIVTGAPPTTGLGIVYDPPLPYDKRQLFQRLPMGNSVKFQAVYPTPFWKDEGYSGTILASVAPPMNQADSVGSTSSVLLSNCFDNSPYSGSTGVLLCFVEGDASVELMRLDREDRIRYVTDYLQLTLGEGAAAPNAIEILDFSWAAQSNIGGAYSSYFPPGVWTQYGEALRVPFGRVYWAGADYAMDGFGYINGAIGSAKKAVEDILPLIRATEEK